MGESDADEEGVFCNFLRPRGSSRPFPCLVSRLDLVEDVINYIYLFI